MAAKLGNVGTQKNKSGAKKRVFRTNVKKRVIYVPKVSEGETGTPQNKATKKITLAASGKWGAKKSCRNHLLLQKQSARKKEADKSHILVKGDAKKMSRLLPSY